MSDLSLLVNKIAQLTSDVERSAAQHNYLVGALTELKKVYDDLQAAAPVIEAIGNIVAPAATSEVTNVINGVTNVVGDITGQ